MKKTTGKSPSSTSVTGIPTLGFGIKGTKPGKSKKVHHRIEGPEIGRLVDEINRLHLKFVAVDGPFKEAKERLKNEFGFPAYFELNHGRMDPPSSLIALGTTGTDARITFKDRYTPGDKEKVEKLMGKLAPVYMREHVTFIIDSDLIPPEKLPEFNTELQKLMKVFGLSDALQIKPGIIPIPGFTIKRHLLEPKLNLQIQKLVMQHSSVTPRG